MMMYKATDQQVIAHAREQVGLGSCEQYTETIKILCDRLEARLPKKQKSSWGRVWEMFDAKRNKV